MIGDRVICNVAVTDAPVATRAGYNTINARVIRGVIVKAATAAV